MGNPIVFIVLAIIAIFAGIKMITARNAIYSALWLVLTMCVLAIFYLILSAPFLAMVQITVYAGAIMVLFLFVIMLLGAEQIDADATLTDKAPPILFATLLALLLGYVVANSIDQLPAIAPPDPAFGSPEAVGMTFFQTYVFPFEVTSILLLTAMIGVVVLQVKRRRDS